MENIEFCGKCKKPFICIERKVFGQGEMELIECPHCGHTIERRTAGIWDVRALTEAELEKLDSKK